MKFIQKASSLIMAICIFALSIYATEEGLPYIGNFFYDELHEAHFFSGASFKRFQKQLPNDPGLLENLQRGYLQFLGLLGEFTQETLGIVGTTLKTTVNLVSTSGREKIAADLVYLSVKKTAGSTLRVTYQIIANTFQLLSEHLLQVIPNSWKKRHIRKWIRHLPDLIHEIKESPIGKELTLQTYQTTELTDLVMVAHIILEHLITFPLYSWKNQWIQYAFYTRFGVHEAGLNALATEIQTIADRACQLHHSRYARPLMPLIRSNMKMLRLQPYPAHTAIYYQGELLTESDVTLLDTQGDGVFYVLEDFHCETGFFWSKPQSIQELILQTQNAFKTQFFSQTRNDQSEPEDPKDLSEGRPYPQK